MKLSTCCGAETEMDEIGICPDCLEHCDFEDEDELQKDIEAENMVDEMKLNDLEESNKG